MTDNQILLTNVIKSLRKTLQKGMIWQCRESHRQGHLGAHHPILTAPPCLTPAHSHAARLCRLGDSSPVRVCIRERSCHGRLSDENDISFKLGPHISSFKENLAYREDRENSEHFYIHFLLLL